MSRRGQKESKPRFPIFKKPVIKGKKRKVKKEHTQVVAPSGE